jgi:hypothetical protein
LPAPSGGLVQGAFQLYVLVTMWTEN